LPPDIYLDEVFNLVEVFDVRLRQILPHLSAPKLQSFAARQIPRRGFSTSLRFLMYTYGKFYRPLRAQATELCRHE
jgi:hypothetical protein